MPYLNLKEVYELKKALHDWFNQSNVQTVKENLEEWFQMVENSSLQTFDSIVKTFMNWNKEILNAFVYPFKNGYIEGSKITRRSSSRCLWN